MMVQVKTAEGILDGEIVKNPYGGEFYSFKGIPYAEPPIGELRFKAPIPKKPWDGVLDAISFGNPSLQMDYFTPPARKIGSEDCLYLNVYTPEVKPVKPLPVMVYIYPGGFHSGSGNDDFFGPEFLVQEDVILVTLNYRVGVLGFLCLDTEDIPGNAGMKDQVAALKWVNKNIENFGGDPKNVTVFGVSAGGMSATFHTISPMAKGLLNRVIAQSGTALTSVLCDRYARERGLALAKRLGCKSDDDQKISKYLKSLPAEKLMGEFFVSPLTSLDTKKNAMNVYFSVVIEKKLNNVEQFLTDDIFEAIEKQENAPDIMLGYAEHEGACYILNDPDIENIPERFNTFRELFVPNKLIPMNTVDTHFEIANIVKDFYYKGEDVTMQNLKNLVDYFTFDVYAFPVLTWTKLCARKRNTNVYLYHFTCKTERNKIIELTKPEYRNLLGEITNHGDDMFYLFPVKQIIKDTKIEPNAHKCIQNIVKMWTNFAKYGNPTPDESLGVKWKLYKTEENNYLEIGNKLTPKTNLDEKELQFWENLFRKYNKEYKLC